MTVFLRSNATIHNESVASLVFSERLVGFLSRLAGSQTSPLLVDLACLTLLCELVSEVGAPAADSVSEQGGLRAAGRVLSRWKPDMEPPEAGTGEAAGGSVGGRSGRGRGDIDAAGVSRWRAVEQCHARAEQLILKTVEESQSRNGARAVAFERACRVLRGVLRMRGNVAAWVSACGCIGKLLDTARGSAATTLSSAEAKPERHGQASSVADSAITHRAAALLPCVDLFPSFVMVLPGLARAAAALAAVGDSRATRAAAAFAGSEQPVPAPRLPPPLDAVYAAAVWCIPALASHLRAWPVLFPALRRGLARGSVQAVDLATVTVLGDEAIDRLEHAQASSQLMDGSISS